MKRERTIHNTWRIIIVIIAIGVVISLFMLFTALFSLTADTVSIVISACESLGLIVSLVVAVRQLDDSKEIARADFLVELNNAFVNNEGNLQLYTALQDCYDGKCEHKDRCAHDCVIDLPKVVVSNYLTFFETVYLLICNGVVTFEMIDDLFAYRFFLAVHSDFVQQEKLAAQPENFKNIFCLEHKWLTYRSKVAHKNDNPNSVYCRRLLRDLMKTDEQKQIYEKWLKEA